LKILIVRLRLIGDVVFTTPVIRALRRRFPDARITYLVESAAAPVVATNPHLSDLIVITHRRGWARIKDDLRLARQLRRARFDLVVDLHGGPRSAWLTWASGAPRRIGYDIDGRTWMYTQAVHRPRGLHPRHSVENQWDLLPAVDVGFPLSPSRDDDRVEMPPSTDARTAVLDRLRARGVPLGSGARLVVFHVSAGNPFRRWPEASFADVAAGLVRQSTGSADRWVLLTAGPSDHAAVQRVLAQARLQAPDAAHRLVDAGDVTLAELRALLDSAALYIGGDSGPLHVASTSDVPIVGLYGPTLAERSAPWRPDTIPVASVDSGVLPCRPCDQRVCAPGDFRCLTSIPPAAVLAAAERLLEPV
jgi:predicted lipopolysaccharide heptosyltransferase III